MKRDLWSWVGAIGLFVQGIFLSACALMSWSRGNHIASFVFAACATFMGYLTAEMMGRNHDN